MTSAALVPTNSFVDLRDFHATTMSLYCRLERFYRDYSAIVLSMIGLILTRLRCHCVVDEKVLGENDKVLRLDGTFSGSILCSPMLFLTSRVLIVGVGSIWAKSPN